jgi:7-keto-8-aminopelargonate synthetase-like enzyme
MADLEAQLIKARDDGARFLLIATDGVFSMDGYLAKLPEITALAERLVDADVNAVVPSQFEVVRLD